MRVKRMQSNSVVYIYYLLSTIYVYVLMSVAVCVQCAFGIAPCQSCIGDNIVVSIPLTIAVCDRESILDIDEVKRAHSTWMSALEDRRTGQVMMGRWIDRTHQSSMYSALIAVIPEQQQFLASLRGHQPVAILAMPEVAKLLDEIAQQYAHMHDRQQHRPLWYSSSAMVWAANSSTLCFLFLFFLFVFGWMSVCAAGARRAFWIADVACVAW